MVAVCISIIGAGLVIPMAVMTTMSGVNHAAPRTEGDWH
ncbi:putative membrane protein [Candidatus Protofrankia californiensis]|uniref:Putative membrane protein n=1 Tax=Candidatus Protofrankia californiensis TaxID=1839754 RepID=A0A1C3NZU5_9ACTN|nr:putative membrane protein [Candidatus Protofrankia californiensis]